MFKCPLTLFEMFREDCLESGLAVADVVSQRGFYHLFERGSAANELISHLRFKRQVVQKMCGLCGGLALERSELFGLRLPTDDARWESWRGRQKAHFRVIWAERREYQGVRKGVKDGTISDMTLLIMDAGRPIVWPRRHFDSNAARQVGQIKSAFVGVINHSTPCATLFLSPAPGVPLTHKARKETAKQKARSAGTS